MYIGVTATITIIVVVSIIVIVSTKCDREGNSVRSTKAFTNPLQSITYAVAPYEHSYINTGHCATDYNTTQVSNHSYGGNDFTSGFADTSFR